MRRAISRSLGNVRKRQFLEFLFTRQCLDSLDKAGSVAQTDVELVTFVNSASFADLILSISSYLDAVGRPRKWTLYTDDQFSEAQKGVIERLSFVETKTWHDALTVSSKSRYSGKWQLRKFAAYGNYQGNGTTIFLDSDILFYPLFKLYFDDVRTNNWYLPEPAEANNIDDEIGTLVDFKRGMYTVNAGFFVINTAPGWTLGFEYIDRSIASGKDHYFLDQSALNVMYYHDRCARVLDPRVFHASASDHFRISALRTDTFAIRHYVGLIRHKMWQSGWRRYFQ